MVNCEWRMATPSLWPLCALRPIRKNKACPERSRMGQFGTAEYRMKKQTQSIRTAYCVLRTAKRNVKKQSQSPAVGGKSEARNPKSEREESEKTKPISDRRGVSIYGKRAYGSSKLLGAAAPAKARRIACSIYCSAG